MARFGKTGWAAATYVLLAGIQRGISLLILPFITHSMSPAEYGAASMLLATSLFLTMAVAAPLAQLIMRAVARGEENGPALVRVAGIYCYLIMPICAAVAGAVFVFFVPNMLGVSGVLWGIEILAVGFQPAASTFALWVVQAREKLNRYIAISLASVVTTAASKLLLVVGLKLGVLGWVLSDLLSAVTAALFAMALVRLPSVRIESQHLRYALSFTLPLVPHSVSLWALTFLSRPVMTLVASQEDVGLLSFALNLAQLAGLILTESNRANLPRFSRETFPAPTSETLTPVRLQLLASLLVPAFVGCGVALAGSWVFAESYWPSFVVTGVLLIGQMALGLYLIPMNYLTQTAGLPKYSSLASGAGASVILVLVLLLGRAYGPLGVAIATVAAYAVMALVAFFLIVMHKLEIQWRAWMPSWPELTLAAVALALCIVALALPARSSAGLATAGTCIFIIVVSAVLTLRKKAA